MYYRFAENAGVSSSLMALKDTGEGEGNVTFQDTCGANIVHNSFKFLLMLLEDQKLLSGEDWSKWFQRHPQDKEG